LSQRDEHSHHVDVHPYAVLAVQHARQHRDA
jgi:hypothetical protein